LTTEGQSKLLQHHDISSRISPQSIPVQRGSC